MRPLTTDQITEGLAECMVMFRDDMIRAGIITEATPPMFMTEAILGAIQKATASEREACAKAASEAAGENSSLWEPGCWAHAAEYCAHKIRSRSNQQ
jgi:hypothetical protein